MNRVRTNRKKLFKTIANHRIHTLMLLAETTALQGHYTYANRYVVLARKLAMRYLIPLPAEYKRHICKNCYAYLLPGQNARIRIHRGKIITKCHTCHHTNRHPLHQRHR